MAFKKWSGIFQSNTEAEKTKDKTDIEAMKDFLDMEQLIQNNEVKLGEIIKGMSETVITIVEERSSLYGEGANLRKKESGIRAALRDRNLPEFKSEEKLIQEMQNLLIVLAKAKEILKVLANDHKLTETSDIEFSRIFHSSYNKYMALMERFNEVSVGVKISKYYYNPVVDNIVEQIHQGTTHEEKRDLMLLKLKKTFEEILKEYKKIEEEDYILMNFYASLGKNAELDKIELAKQLGIRGEGESKETFKSVDKIITVREGIIGDNGIIVSIKSRKENMDKASKEIKEQITRINVALKIEEELKNTYKTSKKKVEIYKVEQHKKKIVPKVA